MEGAKGVKCFLKRTFRDERWSRPALFMFLVIFMNVNLCSCYSNVRRSGSNVAVDDLKRISEGQKANISPMLRPSNERVSSYDNVKFESKQTEKPLDVRENEVKNNAYVKHNVIQDYPSVNNETAEEQVQIFKPLPIDSKNADQKLDEFIKIVENKKETDKPKDKNGSILDKITKVIDFVEDGVRKTGKRKDIENLERELLGFVDETLSKDTYDIFEGIKIEPVGSLKPREVNASSNGAPRSMISSSSNEVNGDFDHQVLNKIKDFAKSHVLNVNVLQTARYFGFRFGSGKSSFLTGFGLGFLAFGLKKLLLPIFIGAQIVKSVLIAMFLPSILGSLGKIVGKGLSQFSGASSNFGQPQVQLDDQDYKDMGYTEPDPYSYPNPDTIGTLPANTLYGAKDDMNGMAMSRYGPGGAKVTYVPSASDNYYRFAHKKQEDYKVFHNIPASSLLLSNYDPFYSPLLSRLDSVFLRLGLGGGLGSQYGGSQGSGAPERCREKLVCLMYATPAKYAPYSNLVSAQLSRELNELRKPTSDNPEILRFFRYMKAAKDGQEGHNCSKYYPNCPGLTTDTGTAAMITTYNDINKLVSARKL